MFRLTEYFFIITLQHRINNEKIIATYTGKIKSNKTQENMFDYVFNKVCDEHGLNKKINIVMMYYINKNKI